MSVWISPVVVCVVRVILSNMTAKGNLTTKAIEAVGNRVNADRQKQTEIKIRLLELENKCYRAGLKVPLERVHVEAFLFADEKDYEIRLSSLLYVEVNRQKETEAKVRERVKAEPVGFVDTVVDAINEQVSNNGDETIVEDSVQSEAPCTTEPQSIKSGSVEWIATATFSISVPQHIEKQKISDKLHRMLTDAGITSLQSIQVNKK